MAEVSQKTGPPSIAAGSTGFGGGGLGHSNSQPQRSGLDSASARSAHAAAQIANTTGQPSNQAQVDSTQTPSANTAAINSLVSTAQSCAT